MNNLKAEQFRKNMQKLSHTTPFSFWEALRISRFNYFVSSLKTQEVLPPPTIVQKETTIDLPKFDNFPGKENIEEFIRVLLQNFSPKDLIIFFNNINSLRLNPSDIEDKDKDTKFFKAYYDGENNAIFCQEYDYLYHELFHSATFVLENGIRYSGFKQHYQDGDYYIGSGLNEGYTELLTQRYFSHVIKTKAGYTYLTHIASLVEIIVGQDKMQSLYLSANLRGLIYELQKYTSREEAIDFLLMLDHLNNIATYNEKFFKKCDLIKWYFNRIYEFLVKTYAQKTMNLYKEGSITRQMVDSLISEFMSLFASRYTIRNSSFKAIRNNVLERILQTTLECPDLYLCVEEPKRIRKK